MNPATSTAVIAGLLALPSACAREGSLPRGNPVCSFVYGGETVTHEVQPADNPYQPSPVPIAGRFAFKGVYLEAPKDVASLNLYLYATSGDRPTLLQQLKYRPPYPKAWHRDARYGFTGRQLLYDAGEREIEYWCTWSSL